MSSRWQPRTTKRNTPPWCYPGLFPVVPPIIGGRPSYIVTYLRWKDTDPAINADEATTLKLPWNDVNERWEANNPGPGLSLGGRVTKQGDTDLYTCRLEIYIDGVESEQHAWIDVPLGPDLPWNSGLLIITEPEESTDQSMRVYA